MGNFRLSYTILIITVLIFLSGCGVNSKKPGTAESGVNTPPIPAAAISPDGKSQAHTPADILSSGEHISTDIEMDKSACPKYRNDERNTGRSSGKAPANPAVIWTFKSGGSIAKPPSIDSDNNIYFGGNDSHFYCLDPQGRLKWKTKLDEWIDSTPVITSRGIVIVGCDDGYLLAISGDGKILWKYYMHAEISSSPVIFRNLIFAGSEDGFLYGISGNGEVKSKFRAKSRILVSSPAVTPDGSIVIGAEDNHIYAVRPDGSLKWQYKSVDEEAFVSPPAVLPNGNIIFASPENKIVCLDKDGKLKWETKLHEEVVLPVCIDEKGKIYAVASDGVLMCIDGSGKILWKTKAPGKEINGGLCLSSDNKIIMTGEKIYIYDTTGKHLRTAGGGGKLTEPIVDGLGRILAGSSNGLIYCIGDK